MGYEDILYPKEVADIMRSVLAGEWRGPNPELCIDSLIRDFLNDKVDKRTYTQSVINAVKQTGCLECVFARLNLECYLEGDGGDTIVIRSGRIGRLPGEVHSIHCMCQLCEHERIGKIEDDKIKSYIDKEAKSCIDDMSEEEFTEAITIPDDPKTIEELAESFYAREDIIKRDRPMPSLTTERKIEILDALKRSGYDLAATREEAYMRLEKLLRNRSFEQNIIGRLAYLIISATFHGFSSHMLLDGIRPKGLAFRQQES